MGGEECLKYKLISSVVTSFSTTVCSRSDGLCTIVISRGSI